ncbi:MAG: hypothetical protein WBC73_02385 [Phormidesmis sp.]
MTLTIEMTPEIEKQLRQAAQAAGLSPNTYALRLIHQSLGTDIVNSFSTERLSKEEADLIETINTSLSEIDWPRYRVLIEKRQDETLSAEDYDALIALTDQLEKANVHRLEAITSLAQLRNTSIDAVMDSLDLKAPVSL